MRRDDLTNRGRFSSIAGMIGLLLAGQAATLSAQSAMNIHYDRVILGGHVMDPASGLDGVRNIGLLDGRIAVITTEDLRGRDTVDARGRWRDQL